MREEAPELWALMLADVPVDRPAPPNNSMQRTALRVAADAERYAKNNS
jgi:hypothetical protein